MQQKSGNRVFKRFLLSYLIVLMVPVLIGMYAYDQTVRVIEEDAQQANLSVLKQSRETLDIRLKEVEQIAAELALNPKVIHLTNIRPPFTDQEYYQIHEVLMDIKKYHLNQFVSDYYIHFPKSGILATRQTVYNLPESYGVFFRYGELVYEEWLSHFQFDGRLNRYFSAESTGTYAGMITFQKFIHPGYSGEARGSIFVTFPEVEISKMFDHLVLEEESWAYILDAAGNVIYGEMPPENELIGDVSLIQPGDSGYYYKEYDNERMFVSYTTSNYNEWTYVAALPAETVLARAHYIKKITWMVTGVSVLIGLGIALMLARRNSRPVRELMETIKDFVTGESLPRGGDYDDIKRTVKQLVQKNNLLKTLMDKQLTLVQSVFYNRLFTGEFKSKQQLLALSSQSGITLQGKVFIVLMLRFSGYDGLVSDEILQEIDRNKALVRTVLSRIKHHHVLIYDARDDLFAVLLDLATIESDSFRSRLEQQVRQLQQILMKEAGISVHIGIGDYCTDPLEVWKSYNEAMGALEYGERLDQKVYWHADIPVESNLYFYPLDMEVRMMNSIRTGNREGLEQIFSHMEEENFHKRKLTDSVVRQLILELKGTLLKTLDSMPDIRGMYQDKIYAFGTHEATIQTYKELKTTFFSICSTMEREEQNKSDYLLNRMIEYIESNYSHYYISLSNMASYFDLSESYTSTFFKEHAGENFSTFLESTRMKEAKRLLSETKLSIMEIAEMTGYSSDKAFRRAFKRHTGVLPSAWRNSFSDGNLLIQD